METMISKRVLESLNKQLNREYYSAILYLNMAAYVDRIGFKDTAIWFKVQYHEEKYHAMRFYEYIQSRGGILEFFDIESPNQEYSSLKDIFEKTLIHEEEVTASINNLMEIAVQEKDHATQIFLQWFITEQVEEEENVNDILTRINLLDGDKQGLLLLDKELGTRILTVPLDFSRGLPKI